MPDALLHILSTRPLPAALIGEAANHGINIAVQSFIETRSVVDDALAQTLGALARRPVAAIFTSSNALSAVWDVIAGGIDSNGPPWKLFCIGQETKRQAIKLFGETQIVGVADSAAALAEVIILAQDGAHAQRGAEQTEVAEELIFFCGDIRREELPQKLADAGLALKEVVVYETRQTPHRTERPYDGIAFFSPSAVESFFSVNTVEASTAVFAIGRTTAQAIKQHSPIPVVISDKPDTARLLQIIIDHFNTNNR